MRRDLVANASHELRTPIGALGPGSRTWSTASSPWYVAALDEMLAPGRAARRTRRAVARPVEARIRGRPARTKERCGAGTARTQSQPTGASRPGNATCFCSPPLRLPTFGCASTSSGWTGAVEPRRQRCPPLTRRRAASRWTSQCVAAAISASLSRIRCPHRSRRGGAGLRALLPLGPRPGRPIRCSWAPAPDRTPDRRKFDVGMIRRQQAEAGGLPIIVELPEAQGLAAGRRARRRA